MDISDILDRQIMDAIQADAKAFGISAKDVKKVLGTLTDQTKAPTRSAASQGELMSLLGDDKDAVAADISDATGVDRAKTGTILTLAAPFLLKYLLGSSSNTGSNSSAALLGALLGGQSQKPSQASLLAGLLGGQSQQTAPNANSTTSLLGSLLGGAPQQTQQAAPSQSGGLGSLLNLMGGAPQQAQHSQQTSGQSGGGILDALMGLLGDKD